MIITESDNQWNHKSSEDRLELFMSALHTEQKNELNKIQMLFNYDEDWILKAFRESFIEYDAAIANVKVEVPKQFQSLFVILYLAVNRIAIKEQMYSVLTSALFEKELIDELISLYRLTIGFLDTGFTSDLNLVPAIDNIRQGEYQHFLYLENELKLLIRSKGKQSINPALKKLTKGMASDQAEMQNAGKKKLDDSNLPSEKHLKVTVDKDWYMLVLKELQGYVSQGQLKDMSDLLKTGHCDQVIYFNEKQNLLVDLFSRLYKNNLLHGVTTQEEVAKWLSIHFTYNYGGKPKQVTYSGALNIISRGLNIPDQKKRICFIEGIK